MQNNQTHNYWLYIGLFLVAYSCYQKYSVSPIIPNVPNVIVPNNPPTRLSKNIYYEEYDKCKELSKQYQRKLVLIFGADWCPYCRDLKKDASTITEFNNYIVCFIDTDKNKNLVEKYRVRGLPTSVIINDQEEELDRKAGYKKASYNEWLKNSKQDSSMSWISLEE